MNVYDYNEFDLDYKQFFELFENPRDYSVLDLGCGNGSLCYHLEQMGFNVTGTDIKNNLDFFIGNFVIDNVLNTRLNKKYDFVIDRGLAHNLVRSQEHDDVTKRIFSKVDHYNEGTLPIEYYDTIDRVTHQDSVILLKVLSPYEIRCSPFVDDPYGPYRFHEDELEDLYYDLDFEMVSLEDTYFYGSEVPHLRGYFALYEKIHPDMLPLRRRRNRIE